MEGDDTWHIKCTSALTSPHPIPPPPPSPAAPPPPPLPPSLNQMDTNSRQYFRPFMAPKMNLENPALVQEPFVFQTLNLDFAKSGKTELGNSFVALLSGHPHHLLSEYPQMPNSRPALAKVQAPVGGGIVRGASSNVSVTSIVPLLENTTSGFVESRPSLVSTSYQTSTSKQAFQGTNEGMATSSVSCNRSTNNSFQNVGQRHPLSTQTSHRMPREANSSVPVHDSTRSSGRPHVMCMNTVGELFLSELGLLGVICFCHNLRMSVANFCKHSGSSANPGEAVRLVNGMTIAQWRKQCFGRNAPDDFRGWDWSEGPSAKAGLVGSRGSTFPILPPNPGSIGSAPTFVDLGKPGDPRNKTLYPKSPYISFGGQAPIKHLTTKDANNLNQRNNRLEGTNHSSKSSTIASQSHMLALAKNQTVNAMNETRDNQNRKGKFGNPTFLYSYSDAQKSFPHECNSSRDGFPSDAFVVASKGSSSNIDLRLGQPSQAHASIGSFSTAINPLQFAACKTQKSQVNLPLKEKADHPMESKKARINLGCNAFRSPSENRVLPQHAVGSSNTTSNSGLEGFAGNPTKNSLISLFLSHLNNEGSSSSQIINTVSKSKHSLLDSTSTKCNISEHASDINGGHVRKNFLDGSALSNNTDKGKQLISFDNRRFSFNFDEPPGTLQTGSDSRIPSHYGIAPSVGNRGNCNHANNSLMIPLSCANSKIGHSKSGVSMNSRSNSVYISEPTGPSHSKSIDHSQHSMDENMRFLALRHMARQEKSPTSVQVGHIHQRLCCHLAGMEDLKQESCYGVQQNSSPFNGRSEQTRHNCYSGNGVGNLVAKLGKRDRNEYCKCAALAQRSKEQDIPTCHVCGADEHPCLRLGGIPNYSSGSVKPISDQKEQTAPFYKRCCCSVLSNHLTECCSSRDYSPSHLNKQSICGETQATHITQACDADHTLQDKRSICSCECSRKHFFIKNDCQTGLWRDVPAKKIENTVATLIDKPSHLHKSLDKTEKEYESMNEQQMSNVCSASSAPATTEVSIEVNKVDYRAMNIVDNKTAYDFVGDEGSVVEKCGSTDGEPGIRECEETLAANSMVVLPSHSPDIPNDELRVDSSSDKEKISDQMNVQSAVQDNVEKLKMNSDSLVPKSGSIAIISESSHCVNHSSSEASSPNGSKTLPQPGVVMQKPIVKRKRSSLSAFEPISLKKDKHPNIPNSVLIPANIPAVNDDQFLTAPEISSENEAAPVHQEKQSATHSKQEGNHLDSDKPPRYMALFHTGKPDNHGQSTIVKKARPVVSGKSGIISVGGVSGQRKHTKMVSLSLILKRTNRCDLTEDGTKPKIISDASNECYNELSSSKLQSENEDSSAYKRKRRDPATVLVSGKNRECFSGTDSPVDEFSMIENESDGGSDQEEELALHHKYRNCQTKPRYREVRSCSLSELLGIAKKSTKLSNASTLGASSSSDINRTANQTKISPSTATGDSFVDTDLGRNSLDDEDYEDGLDQPDTGRSRKVQKHQTFPLNSDASCCVCGSSNKEPINCILECKSCLIKVHQACYGVSKVPKGHWYCRPCKTNSQNTVCVLCGYEGGAMTRAVKSQNIVKGLLKNWKFGTDSCFMKLPPSQLIKCEVSKVDRSCSVTALRSVNSDAFPEGTVDSTSQNHISFARHLDSFPKELQMNSIIAGVLDPSAIQWVHMICGLWTPGTRCPNVDTMSAFDVSGASAARKSTVCSFCNRPGGCCIQCRVPKCSVHFHPWCARQKGLLQSEVEGDNNDKVGFYGSCMLHAAQNGNNIATHPVDAEVESPRKDQICARTESFKGRKSDKGFKPKQRKPPYSDSGGCIVSQEQINAWLHINGQKTCARAVKLPSSDVEFDCRKEYFRYKQSKAWKHLVVYKSGIHALGLYTSQFIMRGAMVVEYVGEIVGLRVADRREIEYQTGRRLQYKSACYFFRIDKEHIIDATRKGGIARFVNHSCMPNCVAKVISVWNEKKVVFFAERDINPGEEITYDYHFNSEDEGQKIPCYCNSKNCRQYLN